MQCFAIELGIDSHGGNTEFLAGSNNSNGNFPAVCDEYF